MPQTKVAIYPTAELAESVAEYADNHDLSESAAWKELARRGLQREVNQ